MTAASGSAPKILRAPSKAKSRNFVFFISKIILCYINTKNFSQISTTNRKILLFYQIYGFKIIIGPYFSTFITTILR